MSTYAEDSDASDRLATYNSLKVSAPTSLNNIQGVLDKANNLLANETVPEKVAEVQAQLTNYKNAVINKINNNPN